MAPTVSTTQFSDPAEVTEFVVNQGNGVKGLSETGIKALPDQYIQPFEERLINKFVNETDEAIPVIDMSNPDESNVAKAICDAAEKWGFFQVINHGVPLEVLDNVKAATHRFFNLPVEEKSKYTKENSLSTNVRFGTSFSPRAEKALEWKDYLRNWVHVPPVPGSFVINIGDAMQILSNGRYKSVEHRVLANGSNNRISVPIFVNPKPESVIGPLPEVIANGEEPIYRDVVYSDYVRYFFKKAHDGKKTVDFAKI
ncbi:hypothetical protein HID58_003404 [Brassica napus]|uniref:Non-haem dioxygenase N-terminal domain-containing protein n=1 Tax=Brassica napus TaxID=3708 RepID=A0ABQ8EQ18_BRANA|nr:hypothetical protein HID58_003404 [Brassica napus]